MRMHKVLISNPFLTRMDYGSDSKLLVLITDRGKKIFFAADIFYRLYKGFAQNLNKRGPFWDQFKSE